MYTPHSLEIALLMMITSAICWGSWANTFKGVKNYRFELFYWDYALGIFIVSLVLAFTMGNTSSSDSVSFLNNVHSADGSNIVYMLIAGAIFNLANLLLVAGIDMAGLAVAFPVSIGIALVVGVVSSYALQPRGNLGLLAAGVACAVVAVILDGKAYGSLASAGRSVSKKSIVTCIVSGVLMGLWAPFVTRAMTHGQSARTVQRGRVSDSWARCFRALIWNVYFMRKPLVGEPVSFSGYFSGPACRTRSRAARRIYLGHRAWYLIWWRRALPEWRFPTRSGNPLPWSRRCGACWPGENSRVRAARPKSISCFMFVFYALAILLVARANG